MCRPAALGGRRCPSHSDPVMVANRNARRRKQYAQKKNNFNTLHPATLLHTHASETVNSFFRKPFDNIEHEKLYDKVNASQEQKHLNITVQKHAGHLVDVGYFAETEVAGTINYSNLNADSYKEFGFKKPGEKDQLPSYARQVVKDLSVRELEDFTKEEIAALTFFSTDEYEWMNGALYGLRSVPNDNLGGKFFKGELLNDVIGLGGTEPKEQTSGLLKEAVSLMDSALNKSPHVPRVVYRGMSQTNTALNRLSIEEWVENNISLGQEMMFDGYQSTSLKRSVAENFASTEGLVYEILTPEGINITSVSEWDEEEEVLLPRKARYMCVGLHKNIKTEIESASAVPRYRTTTVIQLVAIDEKGSVLNSDNHHKISQLRDEDLRLGAFGGFSELLS